MKEILTPKDLAMAIGVSESSLRRWVDGGELKMSRTVGGHRRIPMAEAVRFIRESRAEVVRPEVLGLPASAGGGASDAERLYQALVEGDLVGARGIVVSSYLTGEGLAEVFDGVLAPAMARVGELYQHSARGILVEHRATDVALQVVAHVRQLLPMVGEEGPVAVGGAPSGDPYMLPGATVAAVLSECGYRVLHYGADTPVGEMVGAAGELGARLVYLSMSGARAAEVIGRGELAEWGRACAATGTAMVVGGRACPEVEGVGNVWRMGTLGELAVFARGRRTQG